MLYPSIDKTNEDDVLTITANKTMSNISITGLKNSNMEDTNVNTPDLKIKLIALTMIYVSIGSIIKSVEKDIVELDANINLNSLYNKATFIDFGPLKDPA